MASKKFTLTIINQDGIVYYGSPDVLFVPSERDIVAIMAYHTPMIMKLGAGDVIVRDGHEHKKMATIKAGIIYVGENTVTVLIG
jgi:F0F1-type ATP synthase epsilon subunit